MKTTVKMLAFPMIGFALASAGAVSTNTAKTSRAALPPMDGYIHTLNPDNPCEVVEEVTCNPIEGPTCLYNGQQVFDKNSENEPCNIPLYRD